MMQSIIKCVWKTSINNCPCSDVKGVRKASIFHALVHLSKCKTRQTQALLHLKLILNYKAIITVYSSSFSITYKISQKSNPNKLRRGYVVSMKTTHTYHKETYHKEVYHKGVYLTSTYFSPLNLVRLQGFRPEGETVEFVTSETGFGGVVSFVSAVWMWLRLCLNVVTGHGQEREPFQGDIDLIEGAPRPNRARRHLDKYFTKRGEIVPARNLRPFCGFGSRHIMPAQFKERLCRLSGWGRVHVYRMVYYAHRLARYALLARFARGDFRRPCGLCRAHLWPG